MMPRFSGSSTAVSTNEKSAGAHRCTTCAAVRRRTSRACVRSAGEDLLKVHLSLRPLMTKGRRTYVHLRLAERRYLPGTRKPQPHAELITRNFREEMCA